MFDPSDLYNVADLIVENKILIDKVDNIIGKQDYYQSGVARSDLDDEFDELSQSLIDKLYNKFSQKKRSSTSRGRRAVNANITTQFGKPMVTNLDKSKKRQKATTSNVRIPIDVYLPEEERDP